MSEKEEGGWSSQTKRAFNVVPVNAVDFKLDIGYDP